jgi:hypothetical protein
MVCADFPLDKALPRDSRGVYQEESLYLSPPRLGADDNILRAAPRCYPYAASDKALYGNFRAGAGGPTSPPAVMTPPRVWNEPEDLRIQETNQLKKKRQGYAKSRRIGGILCEGRVLSC